MSLILWISIPLAIYLMVTLIPLQLLSYCVILSAIYLMVALIPLQLLSYWTWHFLKLSRDKVLILSTLIWVGLNSWLLLSFYQSYGEAVINIRKTTIPGLADQRGIGLAIYQLFIYSLLISLITGVPANIGVSRLILRRKN